MTQTLSVVDFIVLLIFLGISASFGIFHALRGDRQRSADEYLLADRGMHPIPVAISVVVSALSAVTYLGVPAEIYVHGPQYGIVFLNKVIPILFVVFAFCPVLYGLKVTSIYEYLEMRFNKYVRYLCSGIALTAFPLFMGISIYGPALALNAVTGVSLSASIVVSGLVCTFYATLGGIKAVMWADVFQSVIMLSGFLVTAITCCIQVGGLGEVFKINARDGRDTVFDFRLDPKIRHSFWAVFFGLGVQASSYIGSSQMIVQRYLTCRSQRQSQIAAGAGIFLMGSVELLAVITGVCIYAYYAGCDPLSLGKIRLADQIMVYIVVDLFREIPGLAGFLISAVFSATLSTVSSGINAIAALVGYDVIKTHFPEIQGFKFTIVLKCVSVLFGLVGIGMAFFVSILGAILPLTLSIAGALMAPLFGVFCLGIFFPCCNSKGALVGMVCALCNGIWLMVGSFVYPPFIDDPPLFTDQCKLNNLATNFTDGMTSEWDAPMTTPFLNVISLPPDETLPVITQYYSVSYAWYGVISSLITISVGLVVSFLTGANNPSAVDPNLLIPLSSMLCSWRKGKSLDKSVDNKSAMRGNYLPIDKDIRDEGFESKV